METQKFTAEPVEVEAVQFVDSETGEAISQWIAEIYPELPMPTQVNYADNTPYSMMVQTNNGLITAYLNDWIVFDNGEFMPCHPDKFETHYKSA